MSSRDHDTIEIMETLTAQVTLGDKEETKMKEYEPRPNFGTEIEEQVAPSEDEAFDQSIEEREIDRTLQPLEIRVNTQKINTIDLKERRRELEADTKAAVDALLAKKKSLRATHDAGMKEAEERHVASQKEAEGIHSKTQAEVDEQLWDLGHDPKPEWVPEPKQAKDGSDAQAPINGQPFPPAKPKRKYVRKNANEPEVEVVIRSEAAKKTARDTITAACKTKPTKTGKKKPGAQKGAVRSEQTREKMRAVWAARKAAKAAAEAKPTKR